MKILCWNVNGYRSAFGKGLPELLRHEKPDIFCAQEIKAHREILESPEFTLPGYRLFCSCAEKKGYSGVATWVREDIFSSCTLLGTGIGVEEFDSEGRFVFVEVGNIILYNIYFPSGTSGEDRQGFKYSFLDALYSHISDLPIKDRQRLVICGDVNICHRDIDIHHPEEATKRLLTGFLPEERAWVTSFLELGFIDAFRSLHGDQAKNYTWWSFRANSRAKNLGWRIDYFFIAAELRQRLQSCAIHAEVRGSDHCPLTLELSRSI